jgi:hypothetical protein
MSLQETTGPKVLAVPLIYLKMVKSEIAGLPWVMSPGSLYEQFGFFLSKWSDA